MSGRLLASGFVMMMFLCISLRLPGQDIDSIVTSTNRTPSSIAQEIQDPAERAAFLALYQKNDPPKMLALARAFLQQYPQSAFLAQAYELAARSSFDLGDLKSGLDFAHKSLVFFPENPLFLIAVADVEAREKQQDAALSDARNALYYLNLFARPIAISVQDWPHIKQTQQATAWFVIGRVNTLQALEKPTGTAQRTASLKQAASVLLKANALNPSDPEIASLLDKVTYALGVSELSAQDWSHASTDFGAVYKQGGELAFKAREQLLAIYDMKKPAAQTGFDAFVREAEEEQSVVSSPSVAQTSASNASLPGYAGSKACEGCHTDIYHQWSQSGMANMLRPYQPRNVIGDFEKNNKFYVGDDIKYQNGKVEITPGPNRTLFARMVLHGGRHFFEIKQSDGVWHTYPVTYTIGSKWQQAYATTLPNGQIHVFPMEYSTIIKKWVNYWRVLDPPGTERSDARNWEKLDASTSYQENCAVCHTTQLRNTEGGGLEPDHLVFHEPGIACEMCHGPEAAHVAAMKKGEIYTKKPLQPPVEFDQLSNRQSVRICAQCHMQSSLHMSGPHGELNYSSTGTFFLTNQAIPYDEFSRKGFYKDGRFIQTTFMVEALERSKCYLKGNVSCDTCHDPHGYNASSNPTSLKFRGQPDLMCVGCHTQFQNKAVATAHTHHLINSEASRCVSCHMPRIMNGMLMPVRTHQIDDIPNAEMTLRFGQDQSPNACLICHTDKTGQWVQTYLQSWKKSQDLSASSVPGVNESPKPSME